MKTLLTAGVTNQNLRHLFYLSTSTIEFSVFLLRTLKTLFLLAVACLTGNRLISFNSKDFYFNEEHREELTNTIVTIV